MPQNQSINDLARAVQAELRRTGSKVKCNALMQALSKVLHGMPYQALKVQAAGAPVRGTTPAEVADAECSKCGSSLDPNGYCTDATCPYNDWPQNVILSDLETASTSAVEERYGVKKRVHTEPVDENLYDQRRLAADEALSSAEFGSGVIIHDADGWEQSGEDWSCTLYWNHADDTASDLDAPSRKGHFAITFKPGSAKIVDLSSQPVCVRPSEPLKPYQVSLHEEPGDKFTTIFECKAEDAEHAYEQAEDAYPGAELLVATPVGDAVAVDGNPENVDIEAEQERIALEELANYRFGDGLVCLDEGSPFALDSDRDRDDWVSKVYLQNVSGGEPFGVSFHVKFKPSTLEVIDVYALDMDSGSDIGERG
jgi:hypothetical protein